MKAWVVLVAKFVAFPAFYLACLALFGYLTFPFARMRERLISEIERRQHGARVDIKHIDSYWFSGVELSGVKLTLPGAPERSAGAFGAPAEPPKDTVIQVDEAHARVELLPLLLGRVRLDFWASAMGGEIKGEVPIAGGKGDLDIAIDKLDLSKADVLAAAIGGIPLKGNASATLSLSPFPKGNGSLEFTISNVVVGDGKTKVGGMIELPAARLGDLTITGEAKDGMLRISKIAANGHDLELAGDGRIALQGHLAESTADIMVRFKFTDAYRTKSDLLKSILGAPGSKIPAIIDSVPKMKRAKRSDGFYGWHVHGPLKKLQFDPSSTDAPAGGGGKGRLGKGDGGFVPRKLPGFNTPLGISTAVPEPVAARRAAGAASAAVDTGAAEQAAPPPARPPPAAPVAPAATEAAEAPQ